MGCRYGLDGRHGLRCQTLAVFVSSNSYSLVVTLRTYISISIYRPIYRKNNAIFDSPYNLLAMISDHIPRKSYHQHNEMKSANSLFCQYFQAFVEIL